MPVTDYQIAIGFVDPSTTAIVDPQPKDPAIDEGIEQTAGSGDVTVDGYASTQWEYNVLTQEQLEDLLTQFGLINGSNMQDTTFYAPRNQDREFTAFYGKVKRPKFPQEGQFLMGFWRGVVFKFTRVEEV